MNDSCICKYHQVAPNRSAFRLVRDPECPALEHGMKQPRFEPTDQQQEARWEKRAVRSQFERHAVLFWEIVDANYSQHVFAQCETEAIADSIITDHGQADVAEGLGCDLRRLQVWAHQVTDALDGRALPPLPDSAPARIEARWHQVGDYICDCTDGRHGLQRRLRPAMRARMTP